MSGLTGLDYGWDAEFVPDPAPTEINGMHMSYAGIYLGGSSAARVTPSRERARITEAGLKTMPIWVPTPGFDNPRQAALDAANLLRMAGVPDHATPWRVLMWDQETGILPDPSWLALAADTLAARGYGSLVYGSPDGSHLFANPPRSGYIVASWDGRPTLYPAPHVVGKQFAAGVVVPGGVVDLDVIDATLLDHLGEVA